jgi:5-formyltetrahydrofolate cyclo-ligase
MEANNLRGVALAARDALPAEVRLRKSDAIWKRLVELAAFQTASTALFYLAHGSEVDTQVMRQLARELGMAVACPRSRRGDHSMAFHLLTSDDELSPGPYGILQPPAEAPLVELGPGCVVLVPGALFDRQGNRLGFGEGYYDRWLAGPGRGLPAVGLAFQEQLTETLPAQAHDIPMDWVLTDMECVDCAEWRA